MGELVPVGYFPTPTDNDGPPDEDPPQCADDCATFSMGPRQAARFADELFYRNTPWPKNNEYFRAAMTDAYDVDPDVA